MPNILMLYNHSRSIGGGSDHVEVQLYKLFDTNTKHSPFNHHPVQLGLLAHAYINNINTQGFTDLLDYVVAMVTKSLRNNNNY